MRTPTLIDGPIGLVDEQDCMSHSPYMHKLKPTVVYDTYWKFAVKRQNIFFSRIKCEKCPWTDDPILQQHKFTNIYRAADRTSQYLIKNIIYQESCTFEDVFFRTVLFKLFNKIETWELLQNIVGNIKYKSFNIYTYNEILARAMRKCTRIYSAAYIMPVGIKHSGINSKHITHLLLLDKMMKDNLPLKIENSKSLQEIYYHLLSYPGVGSFLAYQYTIDLNYSEYINFSENDFVVPGPGAKNGIKKCFADSNNYSECDIIKIVADVQQDEFDRLGLDFKSLWGRKLHLIDCQNIFCEVDKYARVKHPTFCGVTDRRRIKQKFIPNLKPISYWFPPKWGINDYI